MKNITDRFFVYGCGCFDFVIYLCKELATRVRVFHKAVVLLLFLLVRELLACCIFDNVHSFDSSKAFFSLSAVPEGAL